VGQEPTLFFVKTGFGVSSFLGGLVSYGRLLATPAVFGF